MRQVAVLWVVLVCVASVGSATTLSADAVFTFSGGNTLTVVLKNTGAADSSDVPGNILSGLFFNITGSPTLNPQSATVSAGSTLVNSALCNPGPCTSATTNMAGEWGYQFSGSGFSGGGPASKNGIASSGYLTTGLAGNIGNFGPGGTAGTNLDGPASLDGIQFGIIANGAFNPNGGADVPVIQNSVTFVLTGVFTGLTGANISNVVFTYGTAFGENSTTSGCTATGNSTDCGGSGQSTVPEPASILLFGTMMLLTVYATRRKWRVLS